MAAKTSEAILRVSAKNLASKDLREVSTDLDKIADGQKKTATASALAAKALKELTDEQRALNAVSAELQRRGGIAGNLVKAREDVAAAAIKVRDLRRELDQLQSTKASGNFVGNIDKAIGNVEKSLRRANTALDQQTGKYQKVEASAAKIGITSANAAESIEKINVQAQRTQELMTGAANAVERYNGALIESKATLAAQEAAQREITAEAQRRNAVEAAAAAERRAEASALQAQLREQARIREQLTKAFTNSAPSVALGPGNVNSAAESRAAAAVAREAAFRERLVNVIRRQVDGGEKLLASDGRLAAATRKVTAELDHNSRSLDRNNRLGGIFADTGRKSLSVYQRMRGQLLSVAAAYVGLYQAVNLVTSAVTVQQERKRIDIQLGIANKGDVAAAARDVTFLREQADRLGLVYEDIARNFANYKIAGAAVGASNRTIKASFVQATEVVTGLGLSADDAEGVFRAFVQILGKARVQAEELRGQLGDRLPGAVAKFAEANKIPLSQLDAYLKKGKGNVQDFFNFLKAYAESTKGAVDLQSQTLFANFNRLKNAYRDFLEQFAKAGATPELAKVVTALINKLKGKEGAEFALELAQAFAQVGKGLVFIIDHFDTFLTLVKAFIALQALKAVVGLGSGLLNMGVSAFKGAAGFIKLSAELNRAKLYGHEFTTSMKLLQFAMGPAGLAIVAATGLIYAFVSAERAAKKQTDDMIQSMRSLRHASGEGFREISDDAAEKARSTLDQIHDVAQRLAAAKSLASEVGGGIRDKIYEGFVDPYRETKSSVTELEAELARLQNVHQGYVDTAIRGSKKYIQFQKESAAAAKAEAAQQDNFSTGTNSKADSSANSKAEAAAKAAALLAERRKDIEDKAANAILEIDQQLADAQIELNAGTQEQIDANYQATLRKIDDQIQKKKTDLEGLKRDALNIKAPEAAASAQKAIDKLPELQKELELKAHIAAVNASIKLQEDAINASVAERDAKIDLINTKVQLGLLSEVEGRQQALDVQNQYSQAINDGIAKLIAQLEALKASDPDLAKALHVDELIAKLDLTAAKTGELQTNMQLIGKNLGGQLSTGVASFFGTFIKGATGGIEGVNGIGAAFQNAKNGFLDFLADFLVGIGQAILQAILLKAIMNAIRGTSGGYVDAAVGALTGHTGGVVQSGGIGHNNPTRQISAAYFAGAQKFHGGGLPGLRQDEVPAVLKKGEEVLSENDPRNALNGGLKGGQAAQAPRVDVAIHNSIDSGSVVEAGVNTKAGQKAIYNHISANKEQYKRLLA